MKQSLKEELKSKFPDIFSGELGKCKKMKAKFNLKENIQPVFKKKNVPFALLKQTDDKTDTRKNGCLIEGGI